MESIVDRGSSATPLSGKGAGRSVVKGHRGGPGGDHSGGSVSNAGDVNGDGPAKLIIGTWDADSSTKFKVGDSYVVFNPFTIFRRGDSHDDGKVNISDAICSLNWLFLGADEAPCLTAGNATGDVAIEAWHGSPRGFITTTSNEAPPDEANRPTRGPLQEPATPSCAAREWLAYIRGRRSLSCPRARRGRAVQEFDSMEGVGYDAVRVPP